MGTSEQADAYPDDPAFLHGVGDVLGDRRRTVPFEQHEVGAALRVGQLLARELATATALSGW